MLGLESLVTELAMLKKQNEEFTNRIKHLDDEVNALEERVQEKIDEIEIPDMDDYVHSSDLDNNIESYLNDNDYATTSYVGEEIESKVDVAVACAVEDADIDSKIESAIEDLDIEEKVRDLFNDASPAPMSEDAIKEEVSESVRKALAEVLSKAHDQVQKS